MPDTQIVEVDRLDVGFAPFRWGFAQARHDDIAAHFAARRQATPQLWNGRILLMRDFAIAGGVLRGTFRSIAGMARLELSRPRSSQLLRHGGIAGERRRLPVGRDE